MSIHTRKLKKIEFALDDVNFECQVQEWSLDPGIGEGEYLYSFCDDMSIEDADPEPTLELTFFADWRSEGISDFLWQNKGKDVDFTLDHHPDEPDEHVRWIGKVRIRPAPVGGETRDTEQTEITLQCVGEPEYERVND